MVQHIKTGGRGRHLCETIDGQELEVSSDHHQMIVPGPSGEILAWASQRLRVSDCLYDGELPEVVLDPNDLSSVRVPEIVFYPEEKVLCCQSHPEWQEVEEPFPQYILNLARQLLFKEELCA